MDVWTVWFRSLINMKYARWCQRIFFSAILEEFFNSKYYLFLQRQCFEFSSREHKISTRYFMTRLIVNAATRGGRERQIRSRRDLCVNKLTNEKGNWIWSSWLPVWRCLRNLEIDRISTYQYSTAMARESGIKILYELESSIKIEISHRMLKMTRTLSVSREILG